MLVEGSGAVVTDRTKIVVGCTTALDTKKLWEGCKLVLNWSLFFAGATKTSLCFEHVVILDQVQNGFEGLFRHSAALFEFPVIEKGCVVVWITFLLAKKMQILLESSLRLLALSTPSPTN